MAVLEDFQQISALGRGEYAQPPIIEDQDVDPGNRFEKTGVTPISLGNGEGFEEARDTVIGNRPTVAAGLVTECAGDPTLAQTCRAGPSRRW